MKFRPHATPPTAALAALATLMAFGGVGCGQSAQPAPEVDFSGVTAFWQVRDLLASGREPDPATWDRLWATPGYAALEAREHRRAGFTNAFRAAYLPGAAALRDSLRGTPYWSNVLEHLETVPAKRAALQRFRHRLEGSGWLADAIGRAARLLPPGATDRPPPPIAFVIFAADGRGYPTLIVADLANVADKADFEGFFAHELHHYFAAPLSRWSWPDSAASDLLLEALTKLEAEGIADQLDKADVPTLSDRGLRELTSNPATLDFYRRYRAAYARSDSALALLDRRLAAIDAEPGRMKALGDSLYRELPMEGRPLGAFMARTILDTLGPARLASAVGDPLAFLRLYQEAATQRTDRTSLSPPALHALSRLQAGLRAR